MSKIHSVLLLATSVSFITGCAQIQPKAGFEQVEQMISNRLNQQIRWVQNSEEDLAVQEQIKQLLSKDLSADSAVQIALLNNKNLQARYESLGIAQTEVVRAGLLKNPIFSFSAKFPNEPPSSASLEFDLIGDFLNLLMLPARKKFAAQQFEQVQLELADQVLRFATKVKKHYFRLQFSQQSVAVLHEIVSVYEVSFDLAKEFYTAGNIDELQLLREQALYETTRLQLAQNTLTVSAEKETLAQLLGLNNTQLWSIPSSLKAVPSVQPDLNNLAQLAIEQRLDLAAAGKQVETFASKLGTTRNWRLLADAEFGITGERERDGAGSIGPALSLAIPIFDQGQTEIAEANAYLRKSEHTLSALVLEVQSEIRLAQQKMLASQMMAQRYQSTIIPLQEKIVRLSLQQYNYMLLGAFDLLTSRQNEMRVYQDYIHAVRDYWIARADLEQAVGGNLRFEGTGMPQKLPEKISNDQPMQQHGGH